MAARFRDYLVLAIGVAFTAAGAVILMFDRRPGSVGVGLMAISLFGSCALWAALQLRGKRREARLARSLEDVWLPGSFRIPLARGRVAALAIGMAVVALGGLAAQPPLGIAALFAAVGVLGLGLLVALALGFRRSVYLQFEPEGLRLGQGRYSYLVRWDNLAAVDVGEMHGLAQVGLSLCDPAQPLHAIRDEGLPASKAAPILAKHLRQMRLWNGADVAIYPAQFGLSAVTFARGLATYWGDPARRAELAASEALAGSMPKSSRAISLK